jgi:two-component system LytT family response regulator
MERLAVDDRLMLPIDRHFELVKVTCIESIFSAGDYSEVRLTDGATMFILRSLREWLARLPEKNFVRVHRSTILNIDCIDRVEEWFNASFRIHLKSGREPVISSRRYATALRARFR